MADVRRQGDIVLAADVRRAGYSDRTVADAVASGALLRLRRRWLSLPEADPEMMSAARAGVVLTCATAAARQGLWVLRAPGVHVATHPHAGRVDVRSVARVHRARPLVPRRPADLVDPIENVLELVAQCLPHEEALAVWESALNKRLVTGEEMDRLPLRGPARMLLDEAEPLSDSGLETVVPGRLRWLKVRIIPQAWILGHRVDFLIGERLVLQIDGGHHVGTQRDRDIAHDALLTLNGYVVIRAGYRQIVEDWPSVQHDITRAVAQGLHRRR